MTIQGECTTTLQQFRTFITQSPISLNDKEKEVLFSIIDLSFEPTDTIEVFRQRRDILTNIFRKTQPTYCRANDDLFFDSMSKGLYTFVKEHTQFRFLGEMETFYSTFSEDNYPTIFADIHSFVRSSRLASARLIKHYSTGTSVHIPFKDYCDGNLISKYLSDGLREKTAQNYQINAAKAILFFMENFKEYEKLQKAFEASELEAKAKAKEETEMLQEAFEASEPQSWEDFVYEPKTLDRSSSPMKTVADLYQHTKENTKMSAYKQKIALDGLETACNMADPISLIDKKTYIKTLREKGKNLSKIKARNYLLALEESIECFTKDFYRTEGQEFTLGDLLTFMDFYTHHIPHEYHPRSTATRKQDLYTVRKAIQYFRTDRPLLSAFNLSQSKFKQHLDDDGEMTKSTIATYVRGFKGTFLTFMVFYKFWEKPQLLQPEVEVAEVEVTEEAEVGVTEEAEVAGEALIESVKAAIVEQLQQVAFTAPEPPTTIEVEEVVLPEPSKLSQKLQLKGDRVFKYEVPETGLTSNEAMRIALRILTEVVDFDEKDLDRLQTVAGTVKTI